MKTKIRILISLIMGVICSVLLTGCGEKTIRGEVMGVKTDAQTGVFSLILTQDGNEPITVVTDEDTHIFSWIDEVSESDLRAGSMEGITVSVTGRKHRDTLAATVVQIEQLRISNYYVLDDGTQIDLIIGLNQKTYCLSDGTELLLVWTPIGPENVYVAGTEDFGLLSEEAQHNIKAFYQAQGILYDEFQVLADAYDAYYILEDKFSAYTLGQEIAPTASNDEMIYFATFVTMPSNGSYGHIELRLGAAFNKQSGEAVSQLDLFTCKPEEIIRRLSEICGVDDEALVAEMEAEFKPEYVIVFPDNLEITYPAGVLTKYDTSYGMGLDFNEEVRDLLQPWAIPDGSGLE